MTLYRTFYDFLLYLFPKQSFLLTLVSMISDFCDRRLLLVTMSTRGSRDSTLVGGTSSQEPFRSCALGGVNIVATNELLDLLECPICLDLMYPPIFQCPWGHAICSDCKTRVSNSCPTCKRELGNVRCLPFEKLAALIQFSCKYHEFGCSEKISYDAKLLHENLCNFRPYNCPNPGTKCMITGDVPRIVDHLVKHHKCKSFLDSFIDYEFTHKKPLIETVFWKLVIYNWQEHYFCLHFEAFKMKTDVVYMVFLTFLGEDSEVKDFCYSLQISKGGRKMTWEGTPRSIREGGEKIRDSGDGLVIHPHVAELFSDGDEEMMKLQVTGRVWKEE